MDTGLKGLRYAAHPTFTSDIRSPYGRFVTGILAAGFFAGRKNCECWRAAIGSKGAKAHPIPPDRTLAVAARDGIVVPRVIADAGDAAARRFLEFFAATIRNKNTRMAYYRAACQFFAWCD